MPIFDFECPNCDYEEETIQRISDPEPVCPKDGTKMKKVIKKVNMRKGAGLFSVDMGKDKRMGELE